MSPSNYPPGVTDADIDAHFGVDDQWRHEHCGTCHWFWLRPTGAADGCGICTLGAIENEDPQDLIEVIDDQDTCDEWEAK